MFKLEYSPLDPLEQTALHNFLDALKRGEEKFEFKSSGSTGKPKRMIFSRKQLEVSSNLTKNAFKLTESSRLYCPLSMDYVAGKMQAARAYFINCHLFYVGPARNPFRAPMRPGSADFAVFAPMQLQEMIGDPSAIKWLNNCRHILMGGAPLSMDLEMAIRDQIEAPVYHGYGMTETLTHIAIRRVNGKAKGLFYKALPGISLDVDARSCLKILSPVTDNWIQTNDIVELNENTFSWKGRADFVINSGGHKIHPEEIERLFSSKNNGRSCALVGIVDEELGQKAILLIEGAPFDIDEGWKNDLSAYSRPKENIFTPEFPRLPNGKLNRPKLEDLIQPD